MATEKRKRLPKELQDFKVSLKEYTFKEKVKAYFDCSPFSNDLDSQKRVIIEKSFSKEEKTTFYSKYAPIHNAIEKYGDRIRAINANGILYNNYINSALRQRDIYLYTADFLNMILPAIAEALNDTKEERTKERLTGALDALKSYRRVSITAPQIQINKKGTSYEVPEADEFKALKGVIDTLKGILSLLKCYLEALREFLEWVGTPELLPKEFKQMEDLLISRYKPIPHIEEKDPNADKYPLFFEVSKIKEEYTNINYMELPRTIDILKDKNLFANTYRSFYNY